jgi:hypothetical protein
MDVFKLLCLRVSGGKKEWLKDDPCPVREVVQREIQHGVLVPPWGDRRILHLKIPQSVDSTALASFVSALQSFSPTLVGRQARAIPEMQWCG